MTIFDPFPPRSCNRLLFEEYHISHSKERCQESIGTRLVVIWIIINAYHDVFNFMPDTE
jgi:hypothetical protein